MHFKLLADVPQGRLRVHATGEHNSARKTAKKTQSGTLYGKESHDGLAGSQSVLGSTLLITGISNLPGIMH